jgi:hypothetical protein
MVDVSPHREKKGLKDAGKGIEKAEEALMVLMDPS